MEPRYPFVAIDVPSASADELSAALFELGAMGVEERDDQTLARGAGGGKVTLVGSFETREEADAAIAELHELDASYGARLEEIVGDAWRDAWKEHFAPFLLTKRIRVVPPWASEAASEAAPIEGELRLVLEPGRAFGTGLHATTALVAEMLDDHAAEIAGRRVLDVGTGSGILALSALLLGAASATAIDNDGDVIEVVLENAERNGLSSRLKAWAGTTAEVVETYPLVLANIEARVLRPLAPELVRLLAPGPESSLILSGLLEGEHDEMVRLYTSQGRALRHVETRRRAGSGGDGWVAIAFASA